MSVKINIHKNNNEKSSGFNKWYGFVDNDTPINLDGLALHMSEHHTPFSQGTIAGVLKDMVRCIRELNLNSIPVKIDNLAIFKASVEANGVENLAEYTLPKGISRICLCAQATGDFTAAELTKAGNLVLSKMARKMIDDAKEQGNDDNND